MKKVAFWGLSLMLVVTFATSAFAQDIKWKSTEDYKGYMAAYDEADLVKKAANAEKFITTFKDTTDPLAIQQAYMMMIRAHYNAKAFAKVIETADRQAAIAPGLPAADKKTVILMGMDAASRVPNNAKIEEYATKVLAGDPNDVNALVTLSNLLSGTFPTDEAKKDAHFTRTLEITRRAMTQPKPSGAQDAQWNPVITQLRNTECLILLNQKKNAEAIASCETTLKIDKKNGMSWYLIGLALKPSLNVANKNYKDAIDNYNLNRDKGQLVVDELKTVTDGALVALQKKMDELLNAFGRSVAAGGPASAEARKELQNVFTGTPQELDKLITDKKVELDAN